MSQNIEQPVPIAEPLPTIETAYDVLMEVLRLAETDPLRIDMGRWWDKYGWVLDNVVGPYPTRREHYGAEPACGTVGCICGTAGHIIGTPNGNRMGWSNNYLVPKLLGLTSAQARELFLPPKLVDGNLSRVNIGPEAHAKEVICHIARFIDANEDQLRRTPVTVDSSSPYYGGSKPPHREDHDDPNDQATRD